MKNVNFTPLINLILKNNITKNDINIIMKPLLKQIMDYYVINSVSLHLMLNNKESKICASINDFDSDIILNIDQIEDVECKEDLLFILFLIYKLYIFKKLSHDFFIEEYTLTLKLE